MRGEQHAAAADARGGPTAAEQEEVNAVLLREVKQRDAELDQLGRCLLANSKAVADFDAAMLAKALVEHELAARPAGPQALLAQRVLGLLGAIEGDEVQAAHEDRTRQMLESYDAARAALGGHEGAPRLAAQHETAAVAMEGLKAQHAKKVVAMTEQLCEKDAEAARLEDALKQKAEQLRGAHEALAHTSAQLAAVTGATKELSKLQEENHALTTELAAARDTVSQQALTVHQLSDDLAAVQAAHAALGNAGERIEDLTAAHAAAAAMSESLVTKCEDQETRLALLEQQLAARDEALDGASATIADLNAMIAALTGEKDALRNDTEALHAARNEDRDAMQGMQGSLEEHKAKVVQLSESLEEALGSCTAMNDILKELVTDRHALADLTWVKTCELLKVEYAAMRERLAAERAAAAALQERYTGTRAKLLVCEQRLADGEALELAHEEAVLKKDSLAESMLKRAREREGDVDKREMGVAVREVDVKGREESVRQREEQLERLERELVLRRQEFGVAALNTTITDARLEELSLLLEGKEGDVRDLRAQNSALLDRVRSLEIEAQQGDEKCVQLDRVVDIARGQLQDNAKQLEVLSGELHVARERLGEELTAGDKTEEAMRTMAAQLQAAEAEIAVLRAAAEDAAAAAQRQTEALGELHVAHERQLAEVQRLHLDERTELGRRISALHALKDREVSEAGTHLAEMEGVHRHEFAKRQLSHDTEKEELVRALGEAKTLHHMETADLLRKLAESEAAREISRQHAASVNVADLQAAHEAEKGELLRRLSEAQTLHEAEKGELLLKLAEAEAVGDYARQQGLVAGRLAGDAAVVADLQGELAKRQTEADDAVRYASNVWSGIARLTKKFDELEQSLPNAAGADDKYGLACSFLRYMRGWLSLYKAKEKEGIASPAIAEGKNG